MSDIPYDYFNTSVDKKANRAFVEAICAEVIAAVRPKEVIATPYVVGSLLDRAARGEVVRAGSDADFGLGGGDLMLYVVVPLVTNLTSAAFKATGVAGTGGLFELPDPLPMATPEDVAQLARQSGVRMSRKEPMQMAAHINQIVRTQFEQVIAHTRAQYRRGSASRCAPYDDARLRQVVTQHFSSEELRTLCFDLEVPHEDIVFGEHSASVLRLIEYFLRRNELPRLVEALQKARPGVDWRYQ